jgi:hypothetical protein
MVALSKVELSVVLPSNDMRFVMMQPYVDLNTESEPFVWNDVETDRQFERIHRTLDIAKQGRAQFTLFPEYSVPGLTGIQLIHDEIADVSWPANSIIIAGVDGLTSEEYRQLCTLPATFIDERNAPAHVAPNEWVNCAITWVKSPDGSVKKWIQPKIAPSWPEAAIVANQMFRGEAVFLFSAKFANQTDCQFMMLVCFDWIANANGKILLCEILQIANDDSSPNKKDMNILFVLQHNPKPNHHIFLEHARRYFDEQNQYPFIPRTQCAIVFANTAGGPKPGKHQTHGSSSIIFSQVAPYDSNACPPSGAVITDKLRNSKSLGECKDALLRESGSCIHSIRLTLPQFIDLGPTNRALPLTSADVHSIDQGFDDRRTPGAPVPAIVKWLKDQVDLLPTLLVNEENHPLKPTLSQSQSKVSAELRVKNQNELGTCMELAAVRIPGKPMPGKKSISVSGREIQNVDYWDEVESAYLKGIIDVLSIIAACRSLTVTCLPCHAVVVSDNQIFDIIIVTGKSHKECFEYIKSEVRSNGQRIRVVVSRDRDNTLVTERDKSITVVQQANPEKGPIIYDPEWHHVGYQNIISTSRACQLVSELDQQIKELLKL